MFEESVLIIETLLYVCVEFREIGLHIKGYSFRILMGIPGTHWTGHLSLAALFAHNGQEWATREGAYSN